MIKTLDIFGRHIPLYGLHGLIGFLLGLVFLAFVSKKKKIKLDDTVYVYVFACFAAVIGAKILYLLVSVKEIVALFTCGLYSTIDIIKMLLSGGFVFYGGMLAAFLGAGLACKYFKFEYRKMADTIVPTLPLIHAFGRVGCHIEGCCYGKETTGPLFITYIDSIAAPAGVHLLPVQLMEACYDFVLFIILAIFVFTDRFNGKRVFIYLTAYATERFILEFFRGDEVRGFFGPFSTSQWISLGILVYVAVRVVIYSKRKKAVCI